MFWSHQALRHVGGKTSFGCCVDGSGVRTLVMNRGRGTKTLRHRTAHLSEAPLDQCLYLRAEAAHRAYQRGAVRYHAHGAEFTGTHGAQTCLLYTSDAADDLTRVDLG